MLNLITAAQAQALLPGLSAAESAAVPGLCGPASRAVETWCKRSLGYSSYVEYHRPELSRTIRLKNPPVVPGSVELRTELAQVGQVANVDPAVRRSTVTLTTTSLTLAGYGASAPSPTVLTLASYTTLAQLVAAINGVSGWSATANPDYSTWLVADLEPNPGAMGATGSQALLYAYVHDLSLWAMDSPDLGVIELTEGRPQAFRYPDRMWSGFGGGFGGGLSGSTDPRSANVRCSYQAGYDPAGVLAPATPDDLMMGVALTIRAAIDSGQFSGTITGANLGNTTISIGTPMAIPTAAMGYLSAWVKRGI